MSEQESFIGKVKAIMEKPEFWDYMGEYERRRKREFYKNLGIPEPFMSMLCQEGYSLLLIYERENEKEFILDFITNKIFNGAFDNNIEILAEWTTEQGGVKYKNEIYHNKKVKRIYYKREYMGPSSLYSHTEIYLFTKFSLL